MSISLDQARRAKALVKSRFDGLAEVTGVGITRVGDEYALKVNIQSPPASGVRLPARLCGVRVTVHVVGQVRARAVRYSGKG